MYRANRCDSVPSNRLAQKMAKDAELDRLKAAQDSMFTRKQDAYNAQDQAWQARSRARDILNNAHEQKQRAYAVQDASWQAFESVRSSLGPQIDQLNSQQERAFENMKQAFDSASSAHSSRDGAGARRYADQGQGYKAEAQSCVAQRRQLVDHIRSARASHESAKPGFARAKEIFNHAKAEFERAKATHEAAQAHFKRAKADFDKASEAFKYRLEIVKAANKKRKDEKRSIAQRAGVPSRYLDDVYVSTDSSGTSNIYFGGVGAPDGPGHGHYSIDSSGKVTYRRDPFDPHGSHNYVRDTALEARLTNTAIAAALRAQDLSGPRAVQYHDGTVTVNIKSGYSISLDQPVTDAIVVDREHPNEHLHVILSSVDGSVVFSEWRKNH